MRRCTALAETADLAETECCPKMQLLIERLAFRYQFNLSAAGGCLLLALPDSVERLMIAGISRERIGVSHCLADGEACLSCDTDMVFLIVEDELQPVELLHTEAIWAIYVQGMAATGVAQVQDREGNVDLACFAEFWAEQLTHQRWLEEGQRLHV